MPKCTQTRNSRIKVMVNIQSLIHPYIFLQKSKNVGRGFVYLPSLLLSLNFLFVYLLARHSYISSFLMIFLSCFCTLWQCSHSCCEINTTLITTLYFETILTGGSVKSKYATTYRQSGPQISCCFPRPSF